MRLKSITTLEAIVNNALSRSGQVAEIEKKKLTAKGGMSHVPPSLPGRYNALFVMMVVTAVAAEVAPEDQQKESCTSVLRI